MFEYFLLLERMKEKNHKQVEMNIMRTDQQTFNKFMWKAQKTKKDGKMHFKFGVCATVELVVIKHNYSLRVTYKYRLDSR